MFRRGFFAGEATVLTENDGSKTPRGKGADDAEERALSDLGERIRRAQLSRKEPEEKLSSNGSATDMRVAMRLSSEFVGGILVGAGLGWALDKVTGWHPFGLMVFLGLGTAAGVLNVIRAIRELDAQRTGGDQGQDPSGK